MTRVLVTNDDGDRLGRASTCSRPRCTRRATTCSSSRPNSDRSGTGAAIGLIHADQHLDAKKVEMPGCEGIPAYALDGPPGMCVCAARLGAFGDPPEHRRLGHQLRLQHRPGDPALGNRRCRAHRAELRVLRARRERRRLRSVALRHRGARRARRAADAARRAGRAACSTSTCPRATTTTCSACAGRASRRSDRSAPRCADAGDGRLQFELRATGVDAAARLRSGLRRGRATRRSRRSSAWPRRGPPTSRAGRGRVVACRARRGGRTGARGARRVGAAFAAPAVARGAGTGGAVGHPFVTCHTSK